MIVLSLCYIMGFICFVTYRCFTYDNYDFKEKSPEEQAKDFVRWEKELAEFETRFNAEVRHLNEFNETGGDNHKQGHL